MFLIRSIAEDSAARIEELDRIINSVRQPEYPEVDQMLAAALKKLHSHSVTLSVVGQVKAGKSSLINALTGVGDFLPTEVNPWTAVITNLHYGHPDKPQTGGVFHLFSEAEWQRMLRGNSETREMAEKLLPGFDSSVLERQIVEMQQNAKKRLGELYHHLLGKQHAFNSVTPEILERYVSAGYTETESDYSQSTVGRFSGITKSADVFLPAGPFKIPVTLSDTPGINDPFLVRDEITTSSFKDADIFIVTISAHQALNAADVALLKMLSLHSAKKTIIYVNRIDELDNPVGTLPGVLETLDARLRREIANPNYVILSGSAHWGRLAAIGSDEEVAEAIASEGFKSYVDAGKIDPSVSAREQIYQASGMARLADAITDCIRQGRIDTVLAETITQADAAMNLMLQSLREQLRRHGSGLIDSDDVNAVIAAERQNVLARVETLSQLSQQLQAISSTGQGELMSNGDLAVRSVINTVETAINAFIKEQTDTLQERMSSGQATDSWSFDTARLRNKVERQVVQSYAAGRDQIDRLLVEYADKLNAVISPVVGDVYVDKLVENLPGDEVFPGFKPRSTLVEVSLKANRGWMIWKSKDMNVEEAVSKITHVIRSEMFPAIEAVNLTVREAIAHRNGAAMERLRNVLNAANNLIAAEAQTLQQEAVALAHGPSREQFEQIRKERVARAEKLKLGASALEAAQRAMLKHFPSSPPPIGPAGESASARMGAAG